MITANTIGKLTALLGLAGLGACASTGSSAPQPTVCRPASATTLVGKDAPDDATILQSTGSSVVRRIAPGDPTTKDYRQERVTVTIAEGRVVAASCG
ncbi:Peptidase inhibitor I78 family protein [Sphingomonas carotinifaciens]|nr:Peptidase inhibitor I78 family protein [Sphingomonas carotinifaciens]